MFAFCMFYVINRTLYEQTKARTFIMNKLTKKIKSLLKTKPSNAFLLFLTGFFLAQVLLANFLYSQQPLGGWVTALGNISTSTVLSVLLFTLSLCLVALWRSNSKTKTSENKQMNEANPLPQL